MKTMIKISLLFTFIGFYSAIFSQNKIKTITLDGVVVKLDEISEDKPFVITSMLDSKSGKSIKEINYNNYVNNEIKVYSNTGKNSFLKIESKVSINKEHEESDRLTKVSFYNIKGNKIWEKISDLESYYSRIELKGEYAFLRSISPKTYIEELTVYNSNGNITYEDKGILRPYFNSNSNSVCYETESLDIYTLHFYNAIRNSKWSKALQHGQRASYFSISSDGEKVAACIENYLYVWNYDGIEIWKKPYKQYSGFVNFSVNGKYLLWNQIDVSGDIEVYDCNLGNKLYKYSQAISSKDNIKLDYASFIADLDQFALLRFPSDTSTEITIISMKGDVLKKILIDKHYANFCSFQRGEKNTLNIFFDNNLVKSIDINW